MSFIIRNKTGSAVLIDDLGIELPASADYDMVEESAANVALSNDLVSQINATSIVVIDPIDGVSELTPALSIQVVQTHNDPHYGIRGATLDQLDDVDTSGALIGDVLQLQGSGVYTVVPPSALAGSIDLDDLQDVVDTTPHTAGNFYIFEADGTNLITTDGSTSLILTHYVNDTVGAMIGTTDDLIITYNTGTNEIDYAVADSYLRNDGDVLDSGTLTVAAGAAFVITAGAVGFAPTPTLAGHIANKEYVDSVASGLDTKDSCRAATPVGTIFPNYTSSSPSGAPASGAFTGVDISNLDGVTDLAPGNRILVKDQTDPTQNGIYVVVGGSPFDASSADLQRSPDMDGDPSTEVSAGNHTFIENGTINGSTSWTVQGSGELILNTDDIVWTQFSGAGTYTAGRGLSLDGTQFNLEISNLITSPIDATDTMAFNDTTDGITKNRTMSDVLTDLNIYTDTSLTASDGVLITNGDIQMDITNLPVLATPSLAAEMVFDSGATGNHSKATVNDFLTQLDIPFGVTGIGYTVRTAEDTYTTRVIAVDTIAGFEGISIDSGDGVIKDTFVGLDINNTVGAITNMSASTQFIAFDGTNNKSYTGQQIADGVEAIQGPHNAYGTIEGDSGTATANSSNDTLQFLGGVNGGLTTVVTDSTPDTVSFSMDLDKLATTGSTIVTTDTLAISKGTAATTKQTFATMFTDLGVVNGITGAGIIVGDGSSGYLTRSIVASGPGAQEGLIVTNGDGVNGDPTVGLDIVNTTVSVDDAALDDLFVAYDNSTGVNKAFTGQQVADGLIGSSGLNGVSVSTINGQLVLTVVDTTRANKVLSSSDTAITWSENRVGNNDWLQIGSAVDAKSGYIVPHDATIVKVTAQTADNNGNSKVIKLYIDGVENSTIASFTGISGEDSYVSLLDDIDITQGQKLRLRGGVGGRIEDTVINLWIKWRLV